METMSESVTLRGFLDKYPPRCGRCKTPITREQLSSDRQIGLCDPCADLINKAILNHNPGTGTITYEQVARNDTHAPKENE